MQKEAAIDNDFVMHLAEIDNWSKEDHLNNVMTMFDELDVIPIIQKQKTGCRFDTTKVIEEVDSMSGVGALMVEKVE